MGCTGNANPFAAPPYCFSGDALGETLTLKVRSFDVGMGTFDIAGSGFLTFSCANYSFIKFGQGLNINVSSCVNGSLTVNSAKYCSDQNTIQIEATEGPFTIQFSLAPGACGSSSVLI